MIFKAKSKNPITEWFDKPKLENFEPHGLDLIATLDDQYEIVQAEFDIMLARNILVKIATNKMLRQRNM